MRAHALILLVSVVACDSYQGPTVTNGVAVALGVGESAAIAGSVWSVRLDSVTNDSRCPVDAYCAVAGDAKLYFELTSPLADQTIPDNPFFTMQLNEPVVVQGLHFVLDDLAPSRRTGAMIAPAAYRTTVTVQAVAPN